MPPPALWLPVLIHGMYDFLASLDFDYSGLIFIVFIIVVFLGGKPPREDRFAQRPVYPIKKNPRRGLYIGPRRDTLSGLLFLSCGSRPREKGKKNGS